MCIITGDGGKGKEPRSSRAFLNCIAPALIVTLQTFLARNSLAIENKKLSCEC